MALSGLDIYKLLPKTNCKECGFATCLAFAMQLAKKSVEIDRCPFLSSAAKEVLQSAGQPPIKLVSIGAGEEKLETGNETVLFRHEEKFHHPAGIGFIIEDSLSVAQIKEKLSLFGKLDFERVGQQLKVNLVAIRQNGPKEKFLQAIQAVMENTRLALVLMSEEPQALTAALKLCAQRRPLIYQITEKNLAEVSAVVKEFKVPVTVTAGDLDTLSRLTAELNQQGITDLVLNIGTKPIAQKLWDLTQIRRQALKKANRSLGYPVLTLVDSADPYEEVIEAATYIAKYAGIVLMSGATSWQALALLTLRQNIYTDPQKPLQIEPKVYPIGAANEKSPVLVTTNFSLTYYTLLGEVEASKVPSYILSVDTEGMSVLTAWAAEKFTPEKIAGALNKFAVKELVSHQKLVIPGYVAMMSGELEECSGWQIVVGPKEAAGVPSFLKNL